MKERAAPPAGVRIEQTPRGVRLHCWWFSMWAVGDAVAAVFIGSVLVKLGWPFRNMLTTGHVQILGAVACAVAYYCLVRIVNGTTIEVTQDEVRVTHGPLPYRLGRKFPPCELSCLRISQVAHHLKHLGQVMRYSVSATLKDGKQMKLVSGLYHRDRAYFVKRAIGQQLGLEQASD